MKLTKSQEKTWKALQRKSSHPIALLGEAHEGTWASDEEGEPVKLICTFPGLILTLDLKGVIIGTEVAPKAT